MLTLLKPWDTQPQYIVEPSSDVPRPVFLYVPSFGALNTIGGNRGTVNDDLVPSTHGKAYKTGAFANRGLDFGFYQPIASDAWTIVCLCNPASTDGPGAMLSQRRGSGSYRQIDFFVNADDTGASSAGIISLSGVGNGAGESYGSKSGTGVVDGGWHVFSATSAGLGGTVDLWSDGRQLAVTTVGTTRTPNESAQQTRIGNLGDSTGTGYTLTSLLALVVVYPSRLPSSLLAELRPATVFGRLLEPRRVRIAVPAIAGAAIAVPVGTLTLTGLAPTVTATSHQTIAVPAGALTLTGQTPTVTASSNQAVAVPAGALTLAGFAPTVAASNNQAVAVPLGTLTLSGLAPNVLNGNQQVVQVPLGTLTLTGQTPTVAVSANQVIAVPAGTITLAGQTPTVVATNPQLISVPLGTLTLTGLVPTVSNVGVNNQISVPLGTLTMSGGTPVVRVSTDADVFIDRFAARSRITQSLRFGSRITTQVGLRSSLKD